MTDLTEGIGCRLMGTLNEDEAADYIWEKFKEFGYTDAQKVPVTLPANRKTAISRVIFNQGLATEKEWYGNYYEPVYGSVYGSGLVAKVYNIANDIVDITDPKADLVSPDYTGKIAVTKLSTVRAVVPGATSKTTPGALATSYATMVKGTSASALMIYNDEKSATNIMSPLSLSGVVTEIPILAMDGVVGPKILSETSLYMDKYERKNSSNVIAVKKANVNPNNPDAIIHITAHFDSVLGAPGASDNGSGTAALMDLARVYQNVDTGSIELRFAAVGGEEGGLNGSKAYVAALTTTEKAISINFNMDMLSTSWSAADTVSLDISPSRAGVFNLPAALIITGAEELTWIQGTKNVRWFQYGSSDHVSFQNAGMDAASMIRATDETDDIEPTNHKPQDNLVENHSKDRLHEAANMISKGIARAIDKTLTMKVELSPMDSNGRIAVSNSDKLKGLFESLEITLTPKNGGTPTQLIGSSQDNFAFYLPVGEYTATIAGKGTGTANVKGTFGKEKIMSYSTKLGAYELTRSSGGGSSSSSSSKGDTTVSTPAETAKAEIAVKSTIDANGKATANVSDKQITDAIKETKEQEKTATVTIDVTVNQNAKSLDVNLSQNAMKELIASGVKQVVIKNNLAEVNLDLATLKSIGEGNVKLAVEKIDSKNLTADAQKIVGERPVFDFKLTNGNNAVTDFGNGVVELQIPYIPTGNENHKNLQGIFISNNGDIEWVKDSKYDTKTKSMKLSVSHFSSYGIGYKEDNQSFTDIEKHWAKQDVEFVATKGLLNGTGNNLFSPNLSMTRGMFVTALGRLAGVDSTKYTGSNFNDVNSTTYYAPYIAWAAESKVVTGTSTTEFSPDKPITRQEMATIMMNYSTAVKTNLPKAHTESTFADDAKIAQWAKEAVKQMQMAGILSGRADNSFDPTGTATRAEVAAVLHRYMLAME